MASILCGCFGTECWGETMDMEGTDQVDGHGKRMKGQPLKHDPDFKGPIRGRARRPKDLLCLGIFILFIIVLLAIGVYAWFNGVPARIIYPTDSKGRLCGVDNDVQDKPFLLFFDLTRCLQIVSVAEIISGNFDASSLFTCPTPQVCVSQCPTANEFGVRDNPICIDSVDTTPFVNITSVDITDIVGITSATENVLQLLDLIRLEKCAPYYIDSSPVANRCLPFPSGLLNQTQMVFSTNQSLQELANRPESNVTIEDLFRNITIGDITDGTFTNQVLLAAREFALDVYQDLAVVWPGLLIGVAIAVILSFLYVVLIGFIACPIIFIGIVLALLLVTAIAAFGYYQFYCFQNTAAFFSQFNNTIIAINTTQALEISGLICSATQPLRVFIDTALPWFQYQEYAWLAIGIIGTLLLLILIILLIVLAKKIRVSIQIMQEASKAVFGVPTSVVYPILTFLLLIIVLAYWGVVAVFLLTSSEPTYRIVTNGTVAGSVDGMFDVPQYMLTNLSNGDDCMITTFNDTVFLSSANDSYSVSVACQFDQYVTSNFLLGIQIYHLFGLFWLTNFVLALGECTLAGGFASWYWAYKKPKDVPTFALIQSFGRALLFHSGSLAFGALIIAIIQLLRAILAYFQKKLKGKTGKCVQACLCVCACCLWCFEKILRYINRQAYIEIAIYGYDFCTAACKAVNLLLRNVLITAVKDRIVAFLLFLGKLAITAAVGTLAYVGFAGYLGLGEDLWGRPLNYYLIPVALLVAATYLIATGFTSVYHMAVDTVFICAMEDLERNNGKDKPYFMSKKLMKLLNVKNKKRDHTDGVDEVDGSSEIEEIEMGGHESNKIVSST